MFNLQKTMSWRVSFYKADKKEPVVWEKVRDDETGEEERPYINGKEILNNEGTAVWKEHISREQKENPELFEQLINPETGEDFYRVTKAGLRLFIDKYEEEVTKWLEELYAAPDVQEMKDNGIDTNDVTPDDLHLFNLKEYIRHKRFEWKYNFAVKPDEEYKVSNSDYWEYTIFNLIFVYRTFDFDKDMLVLYGG